MVHIASYLTDNYEISLVCTKLQYAFLLNWPHELKFLPRWRRAIEESIRCADQEPHIYIKPNAESILCALFELNEIIKMLANEVRKNTQRLLHIKRKLIMALDNEAQQSDSKHDIAMLQRKVDTNKLQVAKLKRELSQNKHTRSRRIKSLELAKLEAATLGPLKYKDQELPLSKEEWIDKRIVATSREFFTNDKYCSRDGNGTQWLRILEYWKIIHRKTVEDMEDMGSLIIPSGTSSIKEELRRWTAQRVDTTFDRLIQKTEREKDDPSYMHSFLTKAHATARMCLKHRVYEPTTIFHQSFFGVTRKQMAELLKFHRGARQIALGHYPGDVAEFRQRWLYRRSPRLKRRRTR